jgi:hypothetical protein
VLLGVPRRTGEAVETAVHEEIDHRGGRIEWPGVFADAAANGR